MYVRMNVHGRGEAKRTMSAMPPLVTRIGLVWLCLCSLAHAEEHQRRDALLRLGGFLGGGFADWVGKDANGSTTRIKRVAKPVFAAGVIASMDLSGPLRLDVAPFHLAIQPEFVYATKGSRVELDGEYQGAFTNMMYLQGGLLLRAEYRPISRATPYVLLGPEVGFLYAAEFHNSLGDILDAKGDLESTDFGLILGLGTMFELPPYGALGLELRGDLGLVSIDGQGDGDEIRNAALSLLLVYLY